MSEVSIDEFLNARKAFVKPGDVLMKASKAPASWNEETRTARFVMSAEVEDRDRDIIVQEGLDTTEFMKNPIAPFGHRASDFPVGSWSNLAKLLTGRPKRTEGDLTLVPEGKDGVADRLAFHIASGTIRACSIGFIPRKVERRETPEDKQDAYYYPGYRILEAELVECSPVTIPANPAALVKSAEHGDVLARETIEEILDIWVKHPETGLLVPRAEFEKAYAESTGHRITVTGPTRSIKPEGEDGTHDSATVPTEARETEHKAIAEAHISPETERGLFKRFLAFLAGDGIKAVVESEARDIAAADEDVAAEIAALDEKYSALETRLAAKGIEIGA